MKKIIIICVVNTFMSTTMFGMLTKATSIRLAAKNFKPRQFCDKKKFNYDAIIIQLVDENNRLKKDLGVLEEKIESFSATRNIKEPMHAQETITFRSSDRRSSGEE